MKIKFSAILMCVGLLAAGVPLLRYYLPTHMPLATPFPIAAGSTLDRTFTVRSSENYRVYVRTRAVGPLENAWDSGREKSLPAQLHLRISRADREIISRDFDSLALATYTPGTKRLGDEELEWAITSVDLPTTGRYRIELVNATDLGYLSVTQPTLLLRLLYMKDRAGESLIGLIVGLPIFLFGLLCHVAERCGSKGTKGLSDNPLMSPD
ncbi:hypothetical protein ACXR0O_15575 [Verrucomicrobiota bacterium sgz303538]